jgi:hypothetical protein
MAGARAWVVKARSQSHVEGYRGWLCLPNPAELAAEARAMA